MRRQRVLLAVVGCGLAWTMPGTAQEKAPERGSWRAESTTARGVTGDVAFAGQKIVINFAGFTVAQIRTLTPAEAKAAFDGDSTAEGSGNLYRTSIPAEKRFLHHNTLCGSEETQWVVSFVTGKELQLAFFSGASMPVLTPEAIGSNTNLCGTYSYTR